MPFIREALEKLNLKRYIALFIIFLTSHINSEILIAVLEFKT